MTLLIRRYGLPPATKTGVPDQVAQAPAPILRRHFCANEPSPQPIAVQQLEMPHGLETGSAGGESAFVTQLIAEVAAPAVEDDVEFPAWLDGDGTPAPPPPKTWAEPYAGGTAASDSEFPSWLDDTEVIKPPTSLPVGQGMRRFNRSAK